MKISFIVTNYNYADYIQNCIESIYNQKSNWDFEVLVIDDASTDDSVNRIVALQKQHRFKVFFNNFNRGKNYCLNKCINEVSGQYTLILDSDDYLSLNFLEKCFDVFDASDDKSLGFVYSDSFLIDKTNNPIGNGYSTAFDSKLIYKKSYIPECALTVTKALKDILPLSEGIRVGTKHHKWIKIIENNWTGIHIGEPLFYYRMHDKNLSGIGSRVITDISENNKKEFILSGYWPTSD